MVAGLALDAGAAAAMVAVHADLAAAEADAAPAASTAAGSKAGSKAAEPRSEGAVAVSPLDQEAGEEEVPEEDPELAVESVE